MATTQEKISSTSELAPGDLPDPFELPAKSAGSGDADEIISQLAANQIDKMLADANVEPAEAVVEQTVETKIDQASEVVTPVESVESVLSAENSVETTAEEFSKIMSDEPSSFDDSPHVAPGEAVEQAIADVQSAAEELARELEADQLSPAGNFKTDAVDHVHHEPKSAVSVRVGFGILSAINSPFQSLSDNTRELIGSIAIITLVNAMSILLYVMIYR